MQVSWTGADAATISLDQLTTSDMRATLRGPLGFDVPPVHNSTAARLNASGSALIGRRRLERSVVIPLLIEDPVSIEDAIARLAVAFEGPGTLSYTTASRTRQLRDVIYSHGMEGDWSSVRAYDNWRLVDLALVALDPWWYGDGDVAVLTLSAATAFDDAGTTFDAATLFDGAASNPVAVAGDAGAYPVSTITGPFTTLTVGLSGGQSFTLAAALAAGSVITIDTRPGNRGPRLNGGPIDWSLLTSTSRLFELPVGASTLLAQSTGSTGASSVEVTWDERHLTP